MQITEVKNPEFPFTGIGNRSIHRLHLSDIYGDLEKELFPIKNTGNRLWAEVGFLFEEALSFAFRNRLGKRIGEIELDGVVCSPDGIDFENWILEEYKATWKSSRRCPTENWRWMIQLKGYLKVMHMTQAKMRILYLNGNYRDKFGPQYKEFTLDFTQSEIDVNWSMLINHAKRKGWL